MIKFLRRSTVMVLVTALLLAPVAAQAMESSVYDVTDGSVIGDFFICRPLGLAATLLGTVVFVASIPFSVLGNNMDQVANVLIVEPAKFTFDRPLGKFK